MGLGMVFSVKKKLRFNFSTVVKTEFCKPRNLSCDMPNNNRNKFIFSFDCPNNCKWINLCCLFATSLVEIADDLKWRSAWLVIEPDKHSLYITERYYKKLNEKAIPFQEKKCKLYWLKNILCYLSYNLIERPHYGCGWSRWRLPVSAKCSENVEMHLIVSN